MNVTESQHLSPTITDALERAHKSHSEGSTNLAIEQLEAELEKPAPASDLMQFKGRVSLAVAIAEFCVAVGDREKALRTLATEAVSAKSTFQNIKAAGTEDEKRMAFRANARFSHADSAHRQAGS